MIELEERRASIQPIKSKLKISILDDEDIKKINQTALDILEEVGVYCSSQKALRIFADAGANVDFDKEIDKMPSPTGSPAAKRSLPPVREPAIWRMLNTIP